MQKTFRFGVRSAFRVDIFYGIDPLGNLFRRWLGAAGRLACTAVTSFARVAMNLEFSVDKLYETGWLPEADSVVKGTSSGMERLPDGRWYPSVLKIQGIF